jgi:hypothetical protein
MAKDRFAARTTRESTKPNVDRYVDPYGPQGRVRYHPTRGQAAVQVAKGAREKRHPRVARNGVYLTGPQVYREICCCDLHGLPTTDRLFLEDVADKVSAYAEVGRPWESTTRQVQWLSDIHRRVGAGPR